MGARQSASQVPVLVESRLPTPPVSSVTVLSSGPPAAQQMQAGLASSMGSRAPCPTPQMIVCADNSTSPLGAGCVRCPNAVATGQAVPTKQAEDLLVEMAHFSPSTSAGATKVYEFACASPAGPHQTPSACQPVVILTTKTPRNTTAFALLRNPTQEEIAQARGLLSKMPESVAASDCAALWRQVPGFAADSPQVARGQFCGPDDELWIRQVVVDLYARGYVGHQADPMPV